MNGIELFSQQVREGDIRWIVFVSNLLALVMELRGADKL